MVKPIPSSSKSGNDSEGDASTWMNETMDAMAMTGTDSRYEKRTATTRGMPRVSPAVMVTADLDMPGINAAA